RRKPAWILGTTLLSLAKILENMEIGHNVMHGQWDWMNDPQIHSSSWDWDTVYLFQPIYNILLAMAFEWGVAVHDLDFEAIKRGEKSKAQIRRELKGIAGKARTQITKDYIAWPLISAVASTAVREGIEAVRTPSRRE